MTAGLTLLLLAGCRGLPTREERAARRHIEAVAAAYRPDNRRPVLPPLDPEGGLSNYLAYALLNHPDVEQAYQAWRASVELVTAERSLPDPTLSFQADIASTVNMLMFGLSQKLPGPGKLRLRAEVASARSEAAYQRFEQKVQQVAFQLKRTYYELFFLDEQIRITRRNLQLLCELEAIARARNAAGQVTLQDVLRARIARDRVETDLANLEDSRRPKMTAFKAALGLLPDQPDPPLPRFTSTPLEVDEEQLLQIAFESNPSLAALAEEIRAAEAAIALAYREKVPDFTLGAMADVKNSPTLLRPLASMTLPTWRDKIAADIARAQAARLAAEGRLEAAQIALAVTLAEKAFAYREVSRNLALLQDKLIPQSALSVAVARAAYLTGDITFFNLIDAELQQLTYELGEVQARTLREVLMAEITLIVAGIPPAERPWSSSTGDPVLSLSLPADVNAPQSSPQRFGPRSPHRAHTRTS